MHDDKFTKGMRGEFRGDFTRDTFDPMRNFSRVLMQQGRVQVDADWNEQVSILLHYMRQLGRDLMGPHGAPYPDDYNETPLNELLNFKIAPATDTLIQPDFFIYPGRYYVKGICCENEEREKGKELTFRNQQNGLFADEDLEKDQDYLVYLDVWERHLSYVENDYMREKALGGADTASRAQIVWQVKVVGDDNLMESIHGAIEQYENVPYASFITALMDVKETKPGTGQLKVRAKKAAEDDKNPCMTVPEASYRGAENQLYRVEIHDSGAAGTATFKWSRENGSVIFPIVNIDDDTITLEHLGRDDRFGLQPGDWVEVLDDDVVLRNEANPLLKVTAVDRESLQVTLSGTPEVAISKNSEGQIEKHPYLRRWDQRKNADKDGVFVKEGDGNKDDDWIPLEDGVEILFQKPAGVASAEEAPVKITQPLYQTGDYWLIPARTATEDVEWPQNENGNPIGLSPQGVEHHYAPLAIIYVQEGSKVSVSNDLRRQLKQAWKPATS